jgi:hypothetical protein
VLIPAQIGGSWRTLVTQSSQASSESSFYLAYIVALHCATALALLWYFRADRVRIVGGPNPDPFRHLLRRLRNVSGDRDYLHPARLRFSADMPRAECRCCRQHQPPLQQEATGNEFRSGH